MGLVCWGTPVLPSKLLSHQKLAADSAHKLRPQTCVIQKSVLCNGKCGRRTVLKGYGCLGVCSVKIFQKAQPQRPTAWRTGEKGLKKEPRGSGNSGWQERAIDAGTDGWWFVRWKRQRLGRKCSLSH